MENASYLRGLAGGTGEAADTEKKRRAPDAEAPPTAAPAAPTMPPKRTQTVAEEKWVSDAAVSFLARLSPETAPGEKKLRVACYIRVSSANPAQEDSYEAQEKYFSSLLTAHQDWIGVGVYSDYGKSGTQKETRTGFRRLVRHCEQGRIDCVIVKSVSRFSRNAADLVEAVRRMKNCGVSVYFEREGIDTSDMEGEFILTVLAAIAQEESRTISENLRWAMEKRFPRGEVQNIAIYGYRYSGQYAASESGYRMKQLAIVEEEAQVVRRVFGLFISGKNRMDIARTLNAERVPAPDGQSHKTGTRGCEKEAGDRGWTGSRIGAMLHSERYCGDVLIQKVYTRSYLDHKSKRNAGEAPKFYIRDHHPAIISRKTYEEAQERFKKNEKESLKRSYSLSGRLVCARCGRGFIRVGTGQNRSWQCASTLEKNGMDICRAERISEEAALNAVRQAMDRRFSSWEEMTAYLAAAQEMDFVEADRSILKKQILALDCEIADAKKRLGQQSRLAALQKEKEKYEAELEEKERYWALKEQDHPERERTLAFIRENTKEAFMARLDEHIRAFILFMTVHDARRFTVRWFDNTITEVIKRERKKEK